MCTCGWATNVHVWMGPPNSPGILWFQSLLQEKYFQICSQIFQDLFQNDLLQEKIYIPKFPQIFSLLFKDEVFPNDLWRQIPNRLQVGDLDWMNLVKPIIFKTWSICIFYMNARLFMMNLILLSPFLTWFWTWIW